MKRRRSSSHLSIVVLALLTLSAARHAWAASVDGANIHWASAGSGLFARAVEAVRSEPKVERAV